MNNQLSVFNFHTSQVRVQFVKNNPYFCLTDVTEILNIKNANASRFSLSEAGIHKMYIRSSGQNREITFINEPNLYRVIFRSNKKEAVEFQDWVFDEVLPSIRKTGSYSLTINTQQQHEIKEAVHQNVSRTGRTFQAVYHDLYNRFQIPKYQDLLVKDFDEAMKYLETPKGIEKPSYLLDIPFDLRLDRTYKVTVRNGQASRCAVMYASLQTDDGTAWDN